MLNFSKKSSIGLDIGDLSLKAVQMKKKNNSFLVSSFAYKDIPEGFVQEGIIKKENELSVLIRELLNNSESEPFFGNKVICSLPEEEVFLRVIQLPTMNDHELGQAVKWEVESHIPLDINDVYLDWYNIVHKNNVDSKYMDVLVAVAPKTLVNAYLGLLQKSGLQTIALEPESVAITRGMMQLDDPNPSIIIDIGSIGTNFVIFSAGAIRFTSHSDISDRSFLQAIVKKINVNYQEAEELKNKIGLIMDIDKKSVSSDNVSKVKEVHQALEAVVQKMAKQIKEYILFYHDHVKYIHGPSEKITQAILCGRAALLPNLPEYLSKNLGLPVRLGGYFNKIPFLINKKSVSQSKNSKKILTYNLAFGLALGSFEQ